MTNDILINKVVEITIAKVGSYESLANTVTGNDTADFMQAIYNKLVELNKNNA